MPLPAKARKKRAFMFGSLLICCLSASLLATSFATDYWFVSDSRWLLLDDQIGTGSVHFGLFSGSNEFNTNSHRTHALYVVCLDGQCMYSCATTKETREDQLQMLLDGETNGEVLKENCPRDQGGAERQPLMMLHSVPGPSKRRLTHLPSRLLPEYRNDETSTQTTTDLPQPDELEFMDYGLWVGTIACLSSGLLMAVVGALFAVVNTATTPVEAITGVPGLYLWNGLAATFDIITVILWAVQFHKHLSSNVLLYDANDGWTTEGMEVFGYSFWLVVVAIFVHAANIAIIAIGTYEPKKKTQLEAPDSKGGNIMLY